MSQVKCRKSDDELLKAFRRGDPDAFSQFVSRHQDAIYRLSLLNLGDAELARDAVQEVFFRAWNKLGRWRFGRGKPFTWLYRTMTNVCREIRKKEQKESIVIQQVNKNPGLVEARVGVQEDSIEKRKIEKLVYALPKRQRDVVVLHIYEDLTLTDVATTLEIPLGTVKSNYHKALRNLRHFFPGKP